MSDGSEQPVPGQFDLLRQRRFAAFFLTQILGAFNDNVYKNALIALITFAGASAVSQRGGADTAMLVNLCAGLFILPFFLFSALAGQIADKYEKATLMRRIKVAEIVIMICAGVALWAGSLPMLIGILFMMGMQSAFFGPVKYSILPQHLQDSELVAGNGLVEMGTFLAILLGTIAGTQLAILSDSQLLIGVVVVGLAVCGYLSSRQIPAAPATAPALQIDWNPVRETWRLVRYTRKHRVIFQSILGVAWFWGLGAVYLAQFAVYARDSLGGGASVYTLLLALFSIGIAVGSVTCERLSGRQVEIGLVPFGAAGLTLFGVLLVIMTPDQPLGMDLGLIDFVLLPAHAGLLVTTMLIGVFGGFYIVPLYALIQRTSKPDRLSRAIACNNILNALMMVLAAVFSVLLLAAGMSVPGIFLTVALLNAVVAAYIFTLVPEFLMRFLTWLLIHSVYRVRTQGLAHIPDSGAVILAANHVSFVDAMIIGGLVRRPVRFVMYHRIYHIPVLNFVFRTARAIPIAGRSEDAAMYDRAFEEMVAAIQNGDIVCIFPEGQITATGEMNEFRPGIEKLLSLAPAPVIPVALQGLWGSMFSRKGGPAFFKLPRRMFARISMVLGPPVPAAEVTAAELRQQVLALRGERR